MIVTNLGMHYKHNITLICAGVPLDQGPGTDSLPLFMHWGLIQIIYLNEFTGPRLIEID